MTWGIGGAEHLSGAVLVADVRVTFRGTGQQRDMLKKIHQVAPNIVCGFAGSVQIGFDMVRSLHEYIVDSSGGLCLPTGRLVHRWWRTARRAWKHADSEAQKLGCSLIVAGAQPRRGFIHPNTAYKLRAPEFSPERIRREPVAIGSGNNVEAYRELLVRPAILGTSATKNVLIS